MMVRIFKSEMARLHREESGVALMLTLSVFLFLYVVCSAVYSIGETVRQKVELQNACDSAAYSTALVQADGLSRMAMVNRAMSWTYVQMTNLQIDYITYRWLELVRDRFDQDRTMCDERKKIDLKKAKTLPFPIQIGIASITCKGCKYEGSLKEHGWGWLCGRAGLGVNRIKLNNHDEIKINGKDTPVTFNLIDGLLKSYPKIATYPEQITGMKAMIESFNEALRAISIKMHESMAQTPSAVLYWNLPKDEKGEVDKTLASDFIFYQAVPFPVGEDGQHSPYDFEDDLYPRSLGYFSPLYNTECDERIFLTMADGKVFNSLKEYFGPSGTDGNYVAGGLDQWFVRTHTNEVSYDAQELLELPPRNEKYYVSHPMQNASPEIIMRTYRNYGICRAYKNANRVGCIEKINGNPMVYRGHHFNVNGNDWPSCINTCANNPEQCNAVSDSLGLVADYEWCSGQYESRCYHFHVRLGRKKFCVHWHTYSTEYLSECVAKPTDHNCSIKSGHHMREEYKSCIASGKKLKVKSIPWPKILVFPPCSGLKLWFNVDGMSIGNLLGNLGGIKNLPTTEFDWKIFEWFARLSNVVDPNGFARIYGDDKELIEKYGQFYYGTPAKPWVLNGSFYGKDGATIVGFARKQRNPWVMLFNSISEVISSDKADETGIYSAFNPVKDGYIVAFSAARAAHRFHPSRWAQEWLAENSEPQIGEFGFGEYETRYDAVCDDGYDDGTQRFAKKSDKILEKIHVGCVCNNKKNCSRFARCWNLCETDWDATLLPLRYAWADVSGDYYDSLENAGDVYWEYVGRESENDMDPLELAAASPDAWARFFDALGNSVQVDAEGNIKSEFLMSKPFMYMRAPLNVQQRGSTTVQAPYSSFDIEEAQKADGGVLDLSNLYKIRVL